jgi:putative membrane protein
MMPASKGVDHLVADAIRHLTGMRMISTPQPDVGTGYGRACSSAYPPAREQPMHRLLSGVAAATLAATFVLAPPGSATAQQQPLPTTTTESSASPSSVMPPDLDFILKAASGGMEEVALGDLATQKTQSEQIKQLAALLVEEHTTANGELMQIAASKGIQVPNTTSITSQTVAASMSELNGPEFDLAYVLQQHGAHLAAVAMFEHAANHAMDPDVKAFAQANLPKIQAHTAQIEETAQGLMKK